MKNLIEEAKSVLLGEAKEMSKEVAIAVIKQIKDKTAYDGEVTMNKMSRDNLKADLPKGTKLTRDVPGPNKGSFFGKILSIATGNKDEYYFDGSNFVKNDKTLVSAADKKTFGDLAKKAGVKV